MTDLEKQPQDPAADLALIRNMMAAGRRHAGINGTHLIWWGCLLGTAFFLTYAQVADWIPNQGALVWIIMMVIGWAGSFYIGYRQNRPSGEHNPALEAYASAWFAVGLTMVFHMTATLLGEGTSPSNATTLAGGVIGCAFFVMARVLKIKPLLIAAFGWWAIMSVAIYYPGFPKEFLLVLSSAAFILIAGPGLYLSRMAQDGE